MLKLITWQHILLAIAVFAIIFLSFVPAISSEISSINLPSFLYNFNINGSLSETGNTDNSSSPYWWLNSGAYLNIANGRGLTNQGELPLTNYWRLLYAANNPVDTDLGLHPQNLFRLITRQDTWQNFTQQAYFKIISDNLSESPNRNESNGLLLFNRYLDSDNLYYAGIRRDGAAVIKKKQNGIYTTLASAKIFPGTYNHESNPNLLPQNIWLGLKTIVNNLADGRVSIKLYLDKNWNNSWQLIAQTTDSGQSGTPLTAAGSGGIRTDFMDVIFDNFSLIPL